MTKRAARTETNEMADTSVAMGSMERVPAAAPVYGVVEHGFTPFEHVTDEQVREAGMDDLTPGCDRSVVT
jgi:hypothetical protein